jgi:hypothetical protein
MGCGAKERRSIIICDKFQELIFVYIVKVKKDEVVPVLFF